MKFRMRAGIGGAIADGRERYRVVSGAELAVNARQSAALRASRRGG